MTILSDTKKALGVNVNNLGFDAELLMHLNSAVVAMVQNGVAAFEGVTIDSNTEWPVFTSPMLDNAAKQYLVLKVKTSFDPIANVPIAESLAKQVVENEGRMAYEAEEV